MCSGGREMSNKNRRKNPTNPTVMNRESTGVDTAARNGNWYRLSEWSHTARMCYQFAKSKQWHDGKKVRQMFDDDAMHAIIEDAFLASMPMPIATMVRSDKFQLGLYLKRISLLLEVFGKDSLEYNGNPRTSTRLTPTSSVYLSPSIEKTSMPLIEFIYFFKDGAAYEVLSEWSGIPCDKIREAYEDILTFFWSEFRKTKPSEEEMSFSFGSEVGVHFHERCDVRVSIVYNRQEPPSP